VTRLDFEPYIRLLMDHVVQLYPLPKGFNSDHANFTYVDVDQTHLKLKQHTSDKEFLVPLALVEFANPGLVRMTRDIKPFNGSFV
jgi:hypothetical protein